MIIHTLVPKANTGGMGVTEIMSCRILLFTWHFGALAKKGSLDQSSIPSLLKAVISEKGLLRDFKGSPEWVSCNQCALVHQHVTGARGDGQWFHCFGSRVPI